MASTSQRKAAFICQKLKFLKDQGDLLIGAVGQYISGILTAGESLMTGEDTTIGYLELGQLIDIAVEFLDEKCAEVAEKKQRSQVLARSAVTENDFSIPSNAEITSEQQRKFDQQTKELLSKLSDSEVKSNTLCKKVGEQMSEISVIQDGINQDNKSRLQSLEKQLQKLSTEQDNMKLEMTFQTELKEKLVPVPEQLESMKENLDVLEAKIDKIIDDCSNKHQDIENVSRDLADKVNAKTDSLRVLFEDHDQKMTLLEELKTIMQTLEAESGRNMKDVQKQATTLETNLSQVIQEMALMSPRLQQLELKYSRTRCGFTAQASSSSIKGRDIIKSYSETFSNVGGNFNAESGIFTAPVYGLYVVFVSLRLWENGKVQVSLRYKDKCQGQSRGAVICWNSCTVKGITACNVGVVDMKAGDTLSIYVEECNTNCSKIVWISCFLLE